MRRIGPLLPIALALALALAACASDEGTTEAAAEDPASPIAEFLGVDFSDSEASQARYVEEERARQEVIAACMREQGFDYTPIDPEQYTFFGEVDDEVEWGSDEWVATYGFGISTMRFSQDEVGPDLVGYDDSAFVEEDFVDPNEDYIQSLTTEEQDAYYAALYGDPDDFPAFDETLSDEELEAQFEDFEYEPQGCEGEAWTESGDPYQGFYTEFGDELDEMYQRIESDPRIVEAEAEVADCVADKGFTYDGMENLYMQFEEELSTIDEAVGYPGEDLSDDDFASMSEEEIEAIFNQPRELSDEARSQLADIQARELELAAAVNECGGGFAAQENLYAEIVAEYEQEFLDDNADRLAEFESGS